MKFLIAILFVFSFFISSAQYSQAFTLQTDNDSYLLNRSDKYYTNGLLFTYANRIHTHNKNYEQHFTIAQKIYTPFFLNLTSTQLMDRPFCGYLFAEYGKIILNKENKIIKWNFSLGTIGKASFGEDIQKFIHNVTGLYAVSGWKYQLKQNVCINAGVTYMPILLNTPTKFSIKILPNITANIGNVYTNIQTGVLLAAGFMNNILKSSLLSNTGLNKAEYYFYFQPKIIFQAYNATVQGSLVTKNNTGFIAQPTAVMYQQITGFAFSKNKVLLKLQQNFQTQECVEQFEPHQYGSIQFTYRFK
ncbi:MAG: lipid A deacylase LpxR family protein [Bacteroidetes bacterium]|nr:lipid A deacylase LpxR family protein [Bacteroidota bacterium]MBS1648516.1 lipid A deacylase LpxR family protein [Bacteroidota bacterium]